MFEKIWDKKVSECVGTENTWEGIFVSIAVCDAEF